MKRQLFFQILGALCLFTQSLAAEQTNALPLSSPSSTPGKSATKSAPKEVPKQKEGIIHPEILQQAASGLPVCLHISLSKQRAYLLVGENVAIETPISSGRKPGWTPKGEFVILEKEENHASNLYGDFVDVSGKTLRKNVCSRSDSAPSGANFRGASMKYFMRLTLEGVGMHAGILPGYPASHGCIRLPLSMAKAIYSAAPIKTPVSVTD